MQKEFSKILKIRHLRDYLDLHVQHDTLLYLKTFEISVLSICKLHPAHLLSVTGLAWKAAFKKTKTKLDLLTDVYMLLKVEEGIRGWICHSILLICES